MSEKIWHLARCNLFEQLPPEIVADLERQARRRRFPRKALIYLPADESDAVLLLAEGRVKLCHLAPDGKESILAFVEPGEVFGELAIVDPGERDEYAAALEPSTVILIPRDAIQPVIEQHPSVALEVTRLLGLRRRRIERRLRHLMFRSNRERLAHLLLELAERYGEQDAGGVRLSIRLSHQELAGLIGSTRESVTVALGELQAQGLVHVARRLIVLKDVDRLAASVDAVAPPLPGRNSAMEKPTAASRYAQGSVQR